MVRLILFVLAVAFVTAAAAFFAIRASAGISSPVTLGWDRPFGTVTGYIVTIDGSSIDVGIPPDSATCSCPSYTVTLPSGPHVATVIAYNLDGDSPPSAPFSFIIGSPITIIDFNSHAAAANLNGQYPSGVDWGQDAWWVSVPWGKFTTKSISFTRAGVTSGVLTFITPQRLVSLRAFNGGLAKSTVTLSCVGNPPKVVNVAINQLRTILTGWMTPCNVVTLKSTNGWDTNFDDLAFDAGIVQ